VKVKGELSALLFAAVVLPVGAAVIAPADALREGFRNPPVSARPRTWWHWVHGYVGKEGITADLEAMKEMGLGGFTLFDVGYWPEIHGPVKSLSDEWYDLVLFAGREAERLGLKMGVHNCPGWTSSGGPWVKPEEAMKDYYCVEREDGKVPAADDKTIAILAVPELPADAVRVPDFKLKSFVGNHPFDNGAYKTNVIANVPAASVIPKDKVVDLTHGGSVPTDGRWKILHFKWKVKNITNHPATDEARGLECDKLSKEGVGASDVLYVGNDDPPCRFAPPKIPYGYQLDAVDSFHFCRDAKKDADGFTVLPSGQRYRFVVRSADTFDPAGLAPDFFVKKGRSSPSPRVTSPVSATSLARRSTQRLSPITKRSRSRAARSSSTSVKSAMSAA